MYIIQVIQIIRVLLLIICQVLQSIVMLVMHTNMQIIFKARSITHYIHPTIISTKNNKKYNPPCQNEKYEQTCRRETMILQISVFQALW